jgi:hypothetical protein
LGGSRMLVRCTGHCWRRRVRVDLPGRLGRKDCRGLRDFRGLLGLRGRLGLLRRRGRAGLLGRLGLLVRLALRGRLELRGLRGWLTKGFMRQE